MLRALIVAPAWIGDTVMAQPLFMRHGFAVVQRQTVQLRGMAFENAVMACELRP